MVQSVSEAGPLLPNVRNTILCPPSQTATWVEICLASEESTLSPPFRSTTRMSGPCGKTSLASESQSHCQIGWRLESFKGCQSSGLFASDTEMSWRFTHCVATSVLPSAESNGRL